MASNERNGGRRGAGWAAWVLLATAVLLPAVPAGAQVAYAAQAGGLSLSAGVMESAFTVQYGDRKMAGVAAFLDADSRRHWGLEAEGRWLRYNQSADVQLSTYLAGGRYFLNSTRRLQPYAKCLAGLGRFDFPYGYAHGNYFVLAPGGGVDFRVSHKLRLRLADVEYQDWPQFTFGSMTSVGVSAGIRYRIF